jgi:4-carboxymuconolactone decarboxylase
MARYKEIAYAEMTSSQRRVHDLIVAGKRGRLGGPFQLLIRAPEICEHAAQLGEQLRWGTTLPDRLSEQAIITTARFWRAQYEWFAHAPLAEKAGVPAGAVEAIRRQESPNFVEKDEMLVHRICVELFTTQRLPAATFNEAIAMLGETGLVEVIAIIGYYTLIGNTLNAFQVPLPEGVAPPFLE